MTEWISVTERLPDTERGEWPVKAKQETDIGTWTWDEMIYIEWADGDAGWYEVGKMKPPRDVTHWMPLPDPPAGT